MEKLEVDVREDSIEKIHLIKHILEENYDFSEQEKNDIISQCKGRLAGALDDIELHISINKMQEISEKRKSLCKVLQVDIEKKF